VTVTAINDNHQRAGKQMSEVILQRLADYACAIMRGNGYTDPATGRVADRRVGAPLIVTCINLILM